MSFPPGFSEDPVDRRVNATIPAGVVGVSLASGIDFEVALKAPVHFQGNRNAPGFINLVRFIKALREDFEAPNAKFICATLGQTKKGSGGAGGDVLNGQIAVDGENGKYDEFKGNVATVYSHPLSKGGSSGGHYGHNAETHQNVGEALGRAMAELLAK